MRVKFLFSIFALALSTQVTAAPRGDFVDLVKRWSPTVVDVSATGIAPKGQAQGEQFNLPKDHPFRKFFKQNPKKNRKSKSLGSGFILDAKGIIITNHHVIQGASSIEIGLADGRKFPAKIIGSDQYTDIAVLQILNKQVVRLPAVKLGDPKQVQVGQWVFAIGTPFGLKGTVTAGIVSALNRDIRAGNYDDFIQTDAAINRGNSGGPLFNTQGEVIGINTIIVSTTGSSAGAGFAIPISTALPVIKQLLATGTTSRGWLGVQIQPITEDLSKAMGLASTKGALVAEVIAGSPSEKAGLKRGDIITKFNGREVTRMRDLPRFVAATPVNTQAQVEVIRNGRRRTFKVLLGQLEKAMAQTRQEKRIVTSKFKTKHGLTLAVVSTKHRQRFSIPKDVRGVFVVGVAKNAVAAESGLVSGSVILEIDRRTVRTPKDVYRVLDKAKASGKKSVLVLAWARGQRTFLPLSVK